MTRHSNESDSKALFLRRDAENRLSAGSAPRSSGSPLDRDALARLYAMASDPERSSDALRLLQELQVHQVELDLQREELELNEREMSRELVLYRALFELTPAACLIANREGRIIEANPAAVSLLNAAEQESVPESGQASELPGRALQDFLKQESHASWHELLRKLESGEPVASCELLVGTGGNETVTLVLSARFLPEGDTGDVLLFGGVKREPVLNDANKHQRAE